MASDDILQGIAYGFAACAHRTQKRKYTGDPYVTHCAQVADLVASVGASFEVQAAAMLHDTVEDCGITFWELAETFNPRVAALVLEVSDVSKPSDGNRAQRKALDLAHLAKSSPEGATIKLADMIDNTRSIVKHDPSFARIYIPEKEALLSVLWHGDKTLYAMATEAVKDAKAALSL